MDRGTRRLLHDLDAFGRITAERVPASERLEAEVGRPLARKLLPVEGGRPRLRSAGRRKDVA